MNVTNFFQAPSRRSLLYFAFTFAFFLSLNIKALSISQLSIIYLSLFGLFLINDKAKLQIDWNWLIYGAVCAFVVYLSYVGAQHPEHAIIKTKILRDLALLGFAFYLVTQSDLIEFGEVFLLATVLAFVLIAPITLWEYLGAAKQQTQSAKFFSPDLSYYGHIRHFSYHAFITTVFATILLLNAKQRTIWLYALCIISVAALVISTGRAAIVSYAIFLIFVGLSWLSLTELIKKAAIIIGVVLALLFILWLSPASSLVDSIIERTQFSLDLNTLLSGRVAIWQQGLDAAKPYPILGMGPDSFVVVHDRLIGTSQPHSVVVQFILDYGLLGSAILLLCVLRLLVPVLYRGLSQQTESQLPFLLSCFVVTYIIYSLFDGLFYYPLPMLHFILVIAILFSYTQGKTAKNNKP